MAGSIASLIVRIGAQDTEIQKALASIGEKAKSLDADLKKLGGSALGSQAQKSLETMRSTIDQVTQAQQRLAERATFAARGLEAMGGASRLTDTQLKQVNKTLQDGISAYAALGKEPPAVLRRLADETKNASTATEGWKTSLRGLAGAIAAAFTIQQVVSFGRELLRMGDDIVRTADRTGLLTDEVQKLSFIAKQSGNSLDELVGAIGQMQNRLASGDKSAVAAVNALKISFQELRAAGPYQQLQLIADAVGKIEDPAGRAQLAMDLFGRTGIAILPTLTSEFKKLGDEAPRMSHNTVVALDQAGDALDKFQLQIKVFAAESYNFLGRAFDQFSIATLNLTASLLDVGANLVAMGAKIPGVTRVFPGLNKEIQDTRDRAQFARDAAQQLGTMTTTAGTEARKATPLFTALGDSIGGTGKATSHAADELQRWNEKVAAASGSIRGFQHELDLMHFQMRQVAEIESRVFANRAAPPITSPNLVNVGGARDFSGGGTGPSALPTGPITGPGVFDGVKASLNAFKETWLDFGKVSNGVMTGFVEGLGHMLSGGVMTLVTKGIDLLIGGIKKLFGASEESKKVSPLRDAFFAAAGGLDVLNPKVLQLTGNLKAVEDVFKAKTVNDYNAAIQRLNTILGSQDQAMQELDAAVQKYGFSIDELGPKFAQQKLNEQQGQLLKEWKLLNTAVSDQNVLLTKTKDSFQDVVTAALKSGTTISEELQDPIQRLADMGLLVDENGNKLTDLSRLKFGSLDSEFATLTRAINNLTRALGGAVDEADALAKDREFDIKGNVIIGTATPKSPGELEDWAREHGFPGPNMPTGDFVPVEGFAEGTKGWRNFGSSTRVDLHGVEAVVTPADMVAAQQQTSAQPSGGTPSVQIVFTGPVLAAREYVERELVDPILNGIRRYGLPKFRSLVAATQP